MANIKWICLSDTHFGAENSLLSYVNPETALVDPDLASPTLESLVACLRVLIEAAGGERLPTLILNGDILDSALAEDNFAAMVFDRFIDLTFEPGKEIFDPTIVYLPGNHDHHMWEAARERMYADYVIQTSPDAELEAPWHATRLFGADSTQPVDADLLTALVQRRRGEGLKVQLGYPNVGLESALSPRKVIIHHGHFTEVIYRLMSEARRQLFPKQPVGGEVWDWEADNFAWIDFFWSTLGRSGSAGSDVGLIYDMLQDATALGRLAGELGSMAGDFGLAPLRPIQRWMGRNIATHLTHLVMHRERHQPDAPLTVAGRQGLTAYLDGPVQRQFERERPDERRCPITFLFGHTHKPFQETWLDSTFRQSLPIYNSGGWVVDTEDTNTLQGAAILAIDDECHVASIRMYSQRADSSQYQVSVAEMTGTPPNELESRLSVDLHLDEPPWTEFSGVVAEGVALRHRLLPRIIARGLTYTNR